MTCIQHKVRKSMLHGVLFMHDGSTRSQQDHPAYVLQHTAATVCSQLTKLTADTRDSSCCCHVFCCTHTHWWIRPAAHLRRGFADVLQASLVHGCCQDDVAVVAHDVSLRVVELEGLSSWVLILNGPLADSGTGLLEALRQATTASKDVHCAQGNAIVLCMSPTSTTMQKVLRTQAATAWLSRPTGPRDCCSAFRILRHAAGYCMIMFVVCKKQQGEV